MHSVLEVEGGIEKNNIKSYREATLKWKTKSVQWLARSLRTRLKPFVYGRIKKSFLCVLSVRSHVNNFFFVVFLFKITSLKNMY